MAGLTKEETRTFLELLAEVPDYRKGNAVKYKLNEVLFVGIFAILCGANTYTGMSLFGETHEEALRKYVELKTGIPSHDVFGDIFSRVDIKAVEKCFEIFLAEYRNRRSAGKRDYVVAMDGKTVRKSGNSEHKAAHIETAYVSDLQIVLGQTATEEKSNEITAIPQLLNVLDLSECTVTIDAIGTQTDIAEKIRLKNAEYILAVKDNQPTLAEDIRLYAQNDVLPLKKDDLKAAGRYASTTDKGHGRIETRECWLFDKVDWLNKDRNWKDLNGVAVLHSTRENVQNSEKSEAFRYFIYSHKDMTADRFLTLQRKYWAIENNLHWFLDCCFHEDDMHVRLGHAAVVLNAIRKLCMQMLKADKSVKGSLAEKRQRCAWVFEFACSVIDNWLSICVPLSIS